jgi:PilZ domain
MPAGGMSERRLAGRVPVQVEVRLERKVGRAVSARTVDISPGGARVTSERPLRIDEELRFNFGLPVDGVAVGGVARVLRQDRHNLYALRFENVGSNDLARLGAFVEASAALH